MEQTVKLCKPPDRYAGGTNDAFGLTIEWTPVDTHLT